MGWGAVFMFKTFNRIKIKTWVSHLFVRLVEEGVGWSAVFLTSFEQLNMRWV